MKIDIPEDCKSVNVLFSGGVDSTILLFLLLQQVSQSIPVNTFVFKTYFDDTENLDNVIFWIENRFNIKLPIFKVPKRYIRHAAENIHTLYGGYVYSGCNKVVYHIVPSNYIDGDTPPVRGEAYPKYHIRPFINMDKIEVMKLYQTYDILDLLPLTKSCGFSKEGSCGGCYFCLERQWAVEALGIS